MKDLKECEQNNNSVCKFIEINENLRAEGITKKLMYAAPFQKNPL